MERGKRNTYRIVFLKRIKKVYIMNLKKGIIATFIVAFQLTTYIAGAVIDEDFWRVLRRDLAVCASRQLCIFSK